MVRQTLSKIINNVVKYNSKDENKRFRESLEKIKNIK